jgi:hypothetical protein
VIWPLDHPGEATYRRGIYRAERTRRHWASSAAVTQHI